MKTGTLAVIMFALAACRHASSAVVPQCPVELQASAVDIHVPAGWKRFVPAPLPLFAACMVSGRRKRLAY